MRANEGDPFFFGRSWTAEATAVELCRRQRQAEDEVDVPLGTAFMIFQSVVVRGEDF